MATDTTMRILHLGGGTSSAPDDPLFYFERGFSDQQHEFAVWRWVVSRGQNDMLCAALAKRQQREGLRPASANFFHCSTGWLSMAIRAA